MTTLRQRPSPRKPLPPSLAEVLAELDSAASIIEKHFGGLPPGRPIPWHLQRTWDRVLAAMGHTKRA